MEEEIYDLIYDLIPDKGIAGWSVGHYPPRKTRLTSEMYFERDGKCYQILVKEHPHG